MFDFLAQLIAAQAELSVEVFALFVEVIAKVSGLMTVTFF